MEPLPRGLRLAPLAAHVLFVGLAAACGGSSVQAADRDAPLEGAVDPPLDREGALSDGAADDLGRRLHRLYGGASEATVLLTPSELSGLLDAEAAEQLAERPRLDLGPAVADGDPLGSARYLGVCLQGARLEGAGGPLGLEEPHWVVTRALVVGVRPGRRRVAAWVEGVFVRTGRGFEAIALQRLERPRWEHSDLDLAPCDGGSGRWDPQYIGSATD